MAVSIYFNTANVLMKLQIHLQIIIALELIRNKSSRLQTSMVE